MAVSDQGGIVASFKDLSPYARIRHAALELFARRGVEATSVRAVAKAAGVSPGLVQHYFPSKTDLRDAVDQYVLEVTATAFADLPGPDMTSAGRVEEISQRVITLFRDRALGQRYVARGLIDRDERALAIFDAVFQLGKHVVEEDIKEGRVEPDIDVVWASLHIAVYHFGVILLEAAINRHLADPLRSEPGLERWRQATTRLYSQGLYKSEGS